MIASRIGGQGNIIVDHTTHYSDLKTRWQLIQNLLMQPLHCFLALVWQGSQIVFKSAYFD
jgi:hypothetical protein